MPCLLVGDGRLGGISGTISAYETLKLRGYDVAAIIFADNGLENEVPLSSHLRNRSVAVLLIVISQKKSTRGNVRQSLIIWHWGFLIGIELYLTIIVSKAE